MPQFLRSALALVLLATLVASPATAGRTADVPRLGADPSLTVAIAPAADQKGIFVDVRTVIDAPLAVVERIVRDIDAYPDWIPGMTTARTHGAAVDTSFAAGGSVVFVTTVRLPWPLRDVREELRMRRADSTDGVDGVEYAWRQIRGDLRRNEGRWVLLPRGATQTEVRYQATFQLRSWIPMFLIRIAEQRQAPKLMGNLRARVAAFGASAREVARPPGSSPSTK